MLPGREPGHRQLLRRCALTDPTQVPRTGAIVSPEAVPLELPLAQLGSRTLALLIDWVIQASLGFVLFLGAGLAAAASSGTVPGWVLVTVGLLLGFAVWLGYPVALETLWHGRTLGKAALGLRVVTVEGGQVGFRHSFIRGAFSLIDFFATGGAAAVISALVSGRSQRLGDHVAGTVVVRERNSAPRPVAARFSVPPAAGAHLGGLDVTPLGARDYEVIRTVLLRAPALPAPARHGLAEQVAGDIAARIGRRPDPGVTAEQFLAAVAERIQQRAAAWRPEEERSAGRTALEQRAEPGAWPVPGGPDGMAGPPQAAGVADARPAAGDPDGPDGERTQREPAPADAPSDPAPPSSRFAPPA